MGLQINIIEKKKKKKEDISLEGNFISSFQTFLTITVSIQ